MSPQTGHVSPVFVPRSVLESLEDTGSFAKGLSAKLDALDGGRGMELSITEKR